MMKKTPRQILLQDANPKDLDFDYSGLQMNVAEKVSELPSIARAGAPGLIPSGDG